ncbi:MAG: right-handed parallel beta-helix repeat-containing protein [Deltaproteobacteria bacterium]|nr:right-handed parallel beta-helix repeat-containing protein [Deltaproteobacteria bacterium]
MRRNLTAIIAILGLLLASQAMAKDWYVAAGSGGDGSKAKPFGDPQKAISGAVSGDVIHVTQGEYYGKLKVGYLVVDKRGLTLVGGYKDKTFSERNPFKYPTTVGKHPKSKSSTFQGSDIRVHMGNRICDHESTTIDGFWFDRKAQNGYAPLDASPDKCPGCLGVPLGSNTKPIIWFEHPDCHVRNCVFMNSALYAIRLTGDGSSAENNLFLNTNYCGIDSYNKGRKLGKGYQFSKILVKNNTFVSVWNCCSLERGAGSFIINGGADITVTDNIFHLSNGNNASMGYTVKDERNFKADQWIHFLRNSVSQIRGGIATVFMTELNASANIDNLSDLGDTPWEVADNDTENPMFKFDKDWFDRYSRALPKQDPSSIKVNMDDFNKMRRMMGLPLDAGKQNLGGQFLAVWYPIEHVQTGAFWKPSNPKLKGRGLNADGPFPIVKAKLVGEGSAGVAAATPPPDRDYQKIDWGTLWSNGANMIDKAVEIKVYYAGYDGNYASGFGKNAKPYLDGADRNSHKILLLRKIEEMERGVHPLKGFVPMGSAGMAYIDKKAKRQCDRKNPCNFSFVVRGVIKKSGAKYNGGQGPQIVIAIDSISNQ